MSRPNNPGVPAGGHPPQRQNGQEQEAQPLSWPPPSQGLAGWPPPPPGQPSPDPYGAASYHYPQPPVQAENYAPPPPPVRPGYAPQFERYQSPPQAAAPQPPLQPPQPPAARPNAQPQRVFQPQQHFQPQQPDQRQAYPQPGYRGADDSAHAPPPPPASRATSRGQPASQHRQPAPDLRGTLADQWPPIQQGRTPAPPQDPRGYDLGSYAAPTPARQAAPPAHHGPAPGRQDWEAQHHDPEREMALADGPDLSGYGHPPISPTASGRAVVAEQDYNHDEVEYEDEPPRRSRGLLIVGALIGAIGLGGGLAYAYKTFVGPTAGGGKPPVVKADKSPARTQPADPGGKQFSNPGPKVMGTRLTDGSSPSDSGPSSQSASTSINEEGVRKVQTLAVRPDGLMAAPVPSAPAAAPGVSIGVPGMQVVDPLRRAPPPLPGVVAAAPSAQPQASQMAPRTGTEPRTISLPAPKAEVAPARVAIAPPPPPPRAAAPRASMAVPSESETVPPPVKKPVPRPAAVGGGSGYVAVLASQRSSMEALKTFADLQQKYGVLQGRTPLVQEANLGEKGVYHRLLVGPAGPKEQANALCSELKTAGYTGCWVMAQ